MDLPDSDPARLEATLRQFSWINRLLTGARRLLERTVLEDIRRRPGPCTLLDVGAGGADLALWLARRAPSLSILPFAQRPAVIQLLNFFFALSQDALHHIFIVESNGANGPFRFRRRLGHFHREFKVFI